MGITSFSISLLEKVIDGKKNVIELGAQNLYDQNYPHPTYANIFYILFGLDYTCIDINGENGALTWDLSKPIPTREQYDLVTDFGTSEHVGRNGVFNYEAIYNCWKNKHNLLKVGGVMVNENPKTGNWPGHGFNYYTQDFYQNIIREQEYKLIDIGEHPAMNNHHDGWNVYCLFEKTDKPFMDLSKFKTMGIQQS